jgi:hypothetical protein
MKTNQDAGGIPSKSASKLPVQSTYFTGDLGRTAPFPGARPALVLLLINLFNNLDRYVLAAVVKPIK